MAKKISSSTSSKSSSYQTKKSSKKSEEKKSGKTESSGKSSESKSPVKESPSEGSIIQKKECPSDKLNISSDAIEEKKDKKEVPGDFYEKMSEVRDNVINKPEVESFAQKKEEVNIEDLKEILSKREDSGEKVLHTMLSFSF